jgi:hypothetical protein
MNLLHHEALDLLQAEDKLPADERTYVGRVAQIHFNAWHYADSNLWACIAVHIFDSLAEEIEPGQNSRTESARVKIRQKLHSTRKAHLEAQGRFIAAQEHLKAVEHDSEVVLGIIEDHRNVIDRFAWANFKKKFETDLIKKVGKLGMGGTVASIEELKELRDQVRSAKGKAIALLSSLTTLVNPWPKLLFSVLGVLCVGAVFAYFHDRIGIFGELGTLMAASLSFFGAKAKVLHDWLDQAGVAKETYDEFLAAPSEDGDKSELNKARENIEVAKDCLDQTQRRLRQAEQDIKDAEQELLHIRNGGLVYDFLRECVQDDRYRGQLGLISTVREDFEQLEGMLKDWKEDGKKPIERIILYIDDLDRCEADQVVEVLQAVHLLLAQPLFHVVLGVDPRWLEHSLTEAYQSKANGSNGVDPSMQLPVFSPQNYLEKIFQIPFSLQLMGKPGFEDLLDRLTLPKPGKPQGPSPLLNVPKPEKSGDPTAINKDDSRTAAKVEDQPGRNGKEDDVTPVGEKGAGKKVVDPEGDEVPDGDRVAIKTAARRQQLEQALAIDAKEQQAIKALYGLLETPRETKRLVNIYRLLRARVPDFDAYLQSEYQAVILMLGFNVGRPEMGGALLRALEISRETTLDQFLGTYRNAVPTDDQAAVDEFRKRAADWQDDIPMARWKLWAPEVGRYSFQWQL